MISGGKELALCPGRNGGDNEWSVSHPEFDAGILGPQRKNGTPKRAVQNRNRLVRAKRPSYFPCFAYQSALTGVKLFHFSGRSSSAKIAVTGQTGTQAPQSMHSVGWM